MIHTMTDNYDEPAPTSFVCPLTRRLMEDPVMDGCAHSFERTAIAHWLHAHDCCPISRKPLTEEDLIPNHVLSERIEKYKWLREQQRQGMVWKAEDGDTVPSDDDDVDIETARRTRKLPRPSRLLSQIPAQFMLLPQERQVLEIVRVRHSERLRQRRKRWVLVSLVGLGLVIAVIAIGGALAVIKYRALQQQD